MSHYLIAMVTFLFRYALSFNREHLRLISKAFISFSHHEYYRILLKDAFKFSPTGDCRCLGYI